MLKFKHLLLEVENHFLLENVGLIVTPDFSILDSEKFHDFDSEANVVTPSGEQDIHRIRFESVHFNIPDSKVSIDKRWRLAVSFPGASKKQVPQGSKIYVTEQDFELLGVDKEQHH